MKSTYKFKFLVLVAVLIQYATMVLSQTLDEMPQKQRDSLLISTAKEVIMKFGPDYYREYKPPIIKKGAIFPIIDVDQISYSVIISYDSLEEKLEKEYAVVVNFGNNTKKPHYILFGDGWVRQIPADWRTAEIEPTPYKEIEIFPIYDLNNPDQNQEPKNKEELKRRGFERRRDGRWEKVHPDVPPHRRGQGR